MRGALDGVLARIRTPVEAAVSHYQRGRAIAYLYGASGAALAADDFRAAQRLFPGYQPAAAGLRAPGRLVTVLHPRRQRATDLGP